MDEIDLIPEEFHKRIQFQAWLKRAGVALLLICGLLATSYIGLHSQAQTLEKQIDRLQSQKAITTSHRQQLEKLSQQKKDLSQQLQLLAGLRSGAAAEQMFVIIDQSLPADNVWITSWKFRRAGTPVEKVDEAVNTGYFIVIPQTGGRNRNNQKQEETWRIETQMTILGQSMDHAALSDFVLNLTRQAEIENVRVVSTQLTEVNRVKLVNFNLEIVVSSLREKA